MYRKHFVICNKDMCGRVQSEPGEESRSGKTDQNKREQGYCRMKCYMHLYMNHLVKCYMIKFKMNRMHKYA